MNSNVPFTADHPAVRDPDALYFLPLGGAGIVDALLPLSLVWVGIALAPAVLAVMIYRFMNLWLPVIPAIAGLPTLKRLSRRRLAAT